MTVRRAMEISAQQPVMPEPDEAIEGIFFEDAITSQLGLATDD